MWSLTLEGSLLQNSIKLSCKIGDRLILPGKLQELMAQTALHACITGLF